MSHHTEGPWHISALDLHTIGPIRVLTAHGTNVPQLQAVARVLDRGAEETAANVRLIAAAPDLFRFVDAFAACPTESEAPGRWGKDAMDGIIREARALVKAVQP